MKFAIPEISWHNRDPVLSVDFQPNTSGSGDPLRLASGGTDSHVLIWYVTHTETGVVNLEVAADLTQHQKAVNVVRWSPSGHYLASGDDESIIFVWKQKTDKEQTPSNLDSLDEQYKETWVIHKTLRGHMEDVLDISWSMDSLHLVSGSVDNKMIVWDVNRGSSSLTDHKGFVQGVAWDPRGQLIASASTDRVFRTYNIATKKVSSRSSKAILPFPADHPFHGVKVRLYHDDTLQTYYRRLAWSPDGMFVAVPAGRIEPEQGKAEKPINAVYIYTRFSLQVPACILPCGECALVTRWSPRCYAPRSDGHKAAFPIDWRMILAVATKRSVILYDTQQKSPIAIISNIHYTRLTDLTWSPDGLTLIASSTDGFCSIISFTEGELGEVVIPQAEPQVTSEPMETEPAKPETETPEVKPKSKSPEAKHKSNKKMDSFIKFKAPEKSPKKQKSNAKQPKTPVKMDVLEDSAMPSWSDNSNNDIINIKETMKEDKESEVMIIEDSEDIKLVYEETECNKSSEEVKQKSPDKPNSPLTETPRSSTVQDTNFLKQAKVTDIKEPPKPAPSPKAPRRVSFVTLSSPKNKKK